MPNARLGWQRWLMALGISVGLGACSLPREPLHDPLIATSLSALTIETQDLFAGLGPETTEPYSLRAPRYRRLVARARTIELMAEARSAGGSDSAEAGRLTAALHSLARRQLPTAAQGADPAALAADYAAATPGYMADYRRNLERLQSQDEAANAGRETRLRAHENAMDAHEQAVAAYLSAWRAYQAGAGVRPEPPNPPPAAPALGLDAAQLRLRITAIEDILRDALVYERLILDRNR